MEPSMSPSPLCLAPLNGQEVSCDLPSLSLSSGYLLSSATSSGSDTDQHGLHEMKEISLSFNDGQAISKKKVCSLYCVHSSIGGLNIC